MSVNTKSLFVATVVIAFGCRSEAGNVPTSPLLSEVPCEQQLEPTPDCIPSGGGYVPFEEFIEEAANEIQVPLAAPPLEEWPCPVSVYGNAPGRLTSPSTQHTYEFNVSGTWFLDFAMSLQVFLLGQGYYIPPPAPPGGWPAYNVTLQKPGATISFDRARALCHSTNPPSVTFVFFRNARIVDPNVRRTGGGGSVGGSGGGSSNCNYEFVIIEVDYGGGWQTVYEGYVLVCGG